VDYTAEDAETPYVKGSQRVTPPKADHKHEYFRVVTYSYIRRFDGTRSAEKHKFTQPATCINCGHKLRKVPKKIEEVEVSVTEYNRLSKGD
jgi:hypothetical protein